MGQKHPISTDYKKRLSRVRDQGVGGSNPLSPTILSVPRFCKSNLHLYGISSDGLSLSMRNDRQNQPPGLIPFAHGSTYRKFA